MLCPGNPSPMEIDMNFPRLLLVTLALVACKTPAGRGPESELAGAEPGAHRYACARESVGSSAWILKDTNMNSPVIRSSEHMSEPQCREALKGAGRRGVCWESADHRYVNLSNFQTTLRSWELKGDFAIPREEAFAACRLTADPQGEDEYGSEGLRCVPTAKGFRVVGPDGYTYPSQGMTLPVCELEATNAAFGMVCLIQEGDQDGRVTHQVFDMDSHAGVIPPKYGISERLCTQLIHTSGSGGACVYLGEDFKGVQLRKGNRVVQQWSAELGAESDTAFKACRRLALRGKATPNPEPKTGPEAPRPEEPKATGGDAYEGVVSRNPSFRPGTAIAELAIRVGNEEIVVRVDDSTQFDLGQGADLTRLLGVAVTVNGRLDASGVLMASSIRNGEDGDP